jgi:hypothetical protein
MILQNNGTQNFIIIEPLKVTFLDNEYSSQLFISSILDNNYDQAVINWQLKSAPINEERDMDNNITIAGRPGNVYMNNYYTMTGDEYNNWGTDPLYPFQILINRLNLTAV